MPGALKTAAGIAICLGGLGGPAGEAPAAAAGQAMASPQIGVSQAWSLDEAINTWYFRQADLRAYGVVPQANDLIWDDVGWRFFRDFQNDKLPQDLSARCERVLGAMETRERSLSLISLLWRALNGPLFETTELREYSPQERQILADTLSAVRMKSLEWRLEIFENSLDPYLSGGRVTPLSPGIATKAGGGSYGQDKRYYLLKDVNEERWGQAADPETREAAQAYVQDHRYAEQMDLVLTVSVLRRGWVSEGESTMEPFDVMTIDQAVRVSFEIQGDVKHCPEESFNRDETSLLSDYPGQQDVNATIWASLTVGRQYTYTELLNAVYEQNRLKLLAIAYDWLYANDVGLWDRKVPLITAVHRNGALLWPAIREIIESNGVIPTGGVSENATRAFTPAQIAEIHRRAVLKDIDFWMF